MSAPFMQLYVADYLGDTRHLTTEQHGAYLLLLMTMWRSEGALPADDKKLARIAGCTPSRWTKIKDDVLAFFEVEDGSLTNRRLMLELEKASEKSIKRADAGTRGGKAKALKTKKPAVANATPLLCHSSEPDIRTPLKPPKGPSEFERFWAVYPHKVGVKAAAKAWDKAKDRPPLAEVLAAVETYRRTKPADRDWCNPSTWINQGRWADGGPETASASDRAPTFDAPQVRASIVKAKDEDFARRWVDHYCRWDGEGRRLIARTSSVAAAIQRDLAGWATANRVTIEVEPANDADQIKDQAA